MELPIALMKPLPVRKERNVGEYVAPHSARSFVRSAAPPGRSEMVSVNCVRRPSAAMPRCSTRPRHVISMLPPLTTATTRFRRPLASGLYTSNQTQLLCTINSKLDIEQSLEAGAHLRQLSSSPERIAAKAVAPAPSTMAFSRSSSRRIARAMNSSRTTIVASTSGAAVANELQPTIGTAKPTNRYRKVELSSRHVEPSHIASALYCKIE